MTHLGDEIRDYGDLGDDDEDSLQYIQNEWRDNNQEEYDIKLFDDYDDEWLDDLIGVIRSNTSAKKVTIACDYTHSHWNFAEHGRGQNFFQAIAGLSNLEHLTLSGFDDVGGGGWNFPISILTLILENIGSRLTKLQLIGVTLRGAIADFRAAGDVLRGVPQLQELSICGYLEDSLKQSTDAVALLLRGVAQLPNLTKFYMKAMGPNELGQLDPNVLQLVFQNPRLVQVKFDLFEMNVECLQAVFNGIQQCIDSQLNDLQLSACTGLWHPSNVASVSRMIRTNATLERLFLRVNVVSGEETIALPFLNEMANALQSKTTTRLKRLTLKNFNRKKVKIASEKHWAQLVTAAEHNYSLEQLRLLEDFLLPSKTLTPKVGLYLKLNGLGRGKFFRKRVIRKCDWIAQFAHVNDDLDALFYFLSLNPLLCQTEE